jgi:hypothetical protein
LLPFFLKSFEIVPTKAKSWTATCPSANLKSSDIDPPMFPESTINLWGLKELAIAMILSF